MVSQQNMQNIDDQVSGADLAGKKSLTTLVYGLYALGIVTGGIASIVAVIINYIKKSDMAGTYLESHFRWQIRTFWFGMLWGIVGAVTLIIGVGVVVLIADGVWILYRIVRGWLALNESKPV